MKVTRLTITFFAVAGLFSDCSKKSAAPSNTQLLTQHVWQIQQALIQEGNVQTEYENGGVNTTGSNYGLDRFSFKSDGSGAFTDNDGANWTFTWAFTAGDETKMTVTINYSTPVTLNWSFIFLTPTTFTYTESFENAGTEILAEMQLVPA